MSECISMVPRAFCLPLQYCCQSSAAATRNRNEPVVGLYRAALTLPGGETPFGLEVAKEDGRTALYLINGAERTRVSNVRIADDELLAVFPGYENSLRAHLAAKNSTAPSR